MEEVVSKYIEDEQKVLNTSLLFFYLILVALFTRSTWYETDRDSVLFFFLLLEVLLRDAIYY